MRFFYARANNKSLLPIERSRLDIDDSPLGACERSTFSARTRHRQTAVKPHRFHLQREQSSQLAPLNAAGGGTRTADQILH
jgi:hypothetical protein